MPPGTWTEDELPKTAEKFMNILEVYVDDFIAIVQTHNVHNLQHISRGLLETIHKVFLPPKVTQHPGGDSILEKKLKEREGNGMGAKKS